MSYQEKAISWEWLSFDPTLHKRARLDFKMLLNLQACILGALDVFKPTSDDSNLVVV